MLTVSTAVKLWYCPEATDMRLGFDGLFARVRSKLNADPLSGHLFIFRNRTADRLKVLYWGGDGLCLWYKRLEKGTFELPKGDASSVEISTSQLAMLIDGVTLAAPRRKRFSLAKAA